MKIELRGASARNSLDAIGSYLLVLCGWVFRGCSWLAEQVSTLIRGIGRQGDSLVSGLTDSFSTVLGAEVTRRVLTRVGDGLFGVRRGISVVAVLSAPLLALGTGWWVVTMSSYRQIESMAVGTWTGTNPELLVFVGVAVIVAVATVFTVFNSGLLPATVLAMAPAFGLGFARYGLTTEYYGTVGIPDATAIGLLIAVTIGLPLGMAGFTIGTVLRRLRGYFEERSSADQASIQV